MPRADLGLPPMERNHFPLLWVHITSSKRRQTQQLYKLFKPVEECHFVTVAAEGAGYYLGYFGFTIWNGNLKSNRKNTESDPTHYSVWLTFVCWKSRSIIAKSFSEELSQKTFRINFHITSPAFCVIPLTLWSVCFEYNSNEVLCDTKLKKSVFNSSSGGGAWTLLSLVLVFVLLRYSHPSGVFVSSSSVVTCRNWALKLLWLFDPWPTLNLFIPCACWEQQI